MHLRHGRAYAASRNGRRVRVNGRAEVRGLGRGPTDLVVAEPDAAVTDVEAHHVVREGLALRVLRRRREQLLQHLPHQPQVRLFVKALHATSAAFRSAQARGHQLHPTLALQRAAAMRLPVGLQRARG